MNTQSSNKTQSYTKLLTVLVFILVPLALFVLNYFTSGGQLKAALFGTFFWTWVFSTGAYILYISNASNKGTTINKLSFVALLVNSLVSGAILEVMHDSLLASNVSSIYTFGFLVNIPIFVVAVLGLMRERIKQLIVFCVIGGVLTIGYLYYFLAVYVIPHREPGVLWYFGWAGYVITGLLFGSWLLERGRYGRVSFVAAGVLFVNYFIYVNFYALFLFLPVLSLIALLTHQLIRNPVKR